MTMKFLLHKDIKENIEFATAQLAFLVFPNTTRHRKTKRAKAYQAHSPPHINLQCFVILHRIMINKF